MSESKLKEPRTGWYLELGRYLFHANWSRSWDGWGESRDTQLVRNLFALKLISQDGMHTVELTVWRLLIMVGRC